MVSFFISKPAKSFFIWILDQLQYNPVYDVVVSCDESGMIEYWSGSAGEYVCVVRRVQSRASPFAHSSKFPTCRYQFPTNVGFEYKTDTDLYELLKVSGRRKMARSSSRRAHDERLVRCSAAPG